jgi:hypothetical protein
MQLSHTVFVLCPRPLKMLNTTTRFSYNLKKHILSKVLYGQSSLNCIYVLPCFGGMYFYLSSVVLLIMTFIFHAKFTRGLYTLCHRCVYSLSSSCVLPTNLTHVLSNWDICTSHCHYVYFLYFCGWFHYSPCTLREPMHF